MAQGGFNATNRHIWARKKKQRRAESEIHTLITSPVVGQRKAKQWISVRRRPPPSRFSFCPSMQATCTLINILVLGQTLKRVIQEAQTSDKSSRGRCASLRHGKIVAPDGKDRGQRAANVQLSVVAPTATVVMIAARRSRPATGRNRPLVRPGMPVHVRVRLISTPRRTRIVRLLWIATPSRGILFDWTPARRGPIPIARIIVMARGRSAVAIRVPGGAIRARSTSGIVVRRQVATTATLRRTRPIPFARTFLLSLLQSSNP